MSGRRASWSVALVFVVIAAAPVARAWQLSAIPYDAAAVRQHADNIFKENAKIEAGLPGDHDEGAKIQFIVQSLKSLSDLSVVEARVLDALITQAGTGAMAEEAIVRFGNRAVVPLIASVRTTSPTATWARAGAMRCLAEMLRQPNVVPSVSAASRRSVSDLARDFLASARLSFIELNAAAVMAIATGDPALRTAAARLADAAELHARGIDGPAQNIVSKSITEALAKYPPR